MFKSNFIAAGLMAGLAFAVTLMPTHASASSKQCDIRYAKHLIGQRLTRAIKEQARVEANASSVVVNREARDVEYNRLQILTDFDLFITDMYCG
jgi:hypothetical protein